MGDVDGWYLDLIQTKAWIERGRRSLCFRSGGWVAIRDFADFGLRTTPLGAPIIGVISDLSREDDLTRLAIKVYG